jgi:nicotinamidase-related amidase
VSQVDPVTMPAAAGGSPRLVAGTVPYAWPWDGRLAGDRLALVRAGSDPTWRRAAPLDDIAAHRLAVATAAVRDAGGIVVHVRHARPRRPGPFLGSVGADRIVASHAEAPDPGEPVDPRDHVVEAAGVDGFYGSPLDALLRAEGRDQLVIAGWGLEGPVHSTMRTANDQGYECLLLTDAVGASAAATADPALSIVTMSGGIFGALGSTDALCAALAALTAAAPLP